MSNTKDKTTHRSPSTVDGIVRQNAVEYQVIVVDLDLLKDVETRPEARDEDGEMAIKRLIEAGLQPFVGLRVAIERFHFDSLLPYEFEWVIRSICWATDHSDNEKPVLLIEVEEFA